MNNLASDWRSFSHYTNTCAWKIDEVELENVDYCTIFFRRECRVLGKLLKFVLRRSSYIHRMSIPSLTRRWRLDSKICPRLLKKRQSIRKIKKKEFVGKAINLKSSCNWTKWVETIRTNQRNVSIERRKTTDINRNSCAFASAFLIYLRLWRWIQTACRRRRLNIVMSHSRIISDESHYLRSWK